MNDNGTVNVWPIVWMILRTIGVVILTALRIMLIILFALLGGGIKGASKAKMKSSADK